eukprot:scaffold179366_cov41-Prasinocladus_malaysianus.AAC.1
MKPASAGDGPRMNGKRVRAAGEPNTRLRLVIADIGWRLRPVKGASPLLDEATQACLYATDMYIMQKGTTPSTGFFQNCRQNF